MKMAILFIPVYPSIPKIVMHMFMNMMKMAIELTKVQIPQEMDLLMKKTRLSMMKMET